jgi:glutaredoxin-related protein
MMQICSWAAMKEVHTKCNPIGDSKTGNCQHTYGSVEVTKSKPNVKHYLKGDTNDEQEIAFFSKY